MVAMGMLAYAVGRQPAHPGTVDSGVHTWPDLPAETAQRRADRAA